SNPTRPRTNIDQRAHAGSIVDGNATPGAPAAAMRFALPTRWLSGGAWCPRRDSNSHALRRRILNPLRLPFRHSGPSGRLTLRWGHGKRVIALDQRFAAENVSQACRLPLSKPAANQRWRCSEVPWVKLSGIGRRPALRIRVSSPIFSAAFIASRSEERRVGRG